MTQRKSTKQGRGNHKVVAMLVTVVAFAIRCSAGLPAAQSRPRTSDVTSAQASVDREQITALITKYAESIDKADTGLAAQVWWQSPDVSFINPAGWEHGFRQVKQEVYRRLMGQTFSQRRLTVHDVAIHIHGDSAWAEYYWDFHAKLRKTGTPVTTHGRETQIYWKMQGRWRLVHVHYSGLPVPPS